MHVLEHAIKYLMNPLTKKKEWSTLLHGVAKFIVFYFCLFFPARCKWICIYCEQQRTDPFSSGFKAFGKSEVLSFVNYFKGGWNSIDLKFSYVIHIKKHCNICLLN